jgi:predicted small lipoprotein YifL
MILITTFCKRFAWILLAVLLLGLAGCGPV